MKMFVRILQVVMALYLLTGSFYMINNYEFIASFWAVNNLPSYFWIILGIVQIILCIGLLVSAKESLRKYATPSAIGLALIVLAGIFLYSTYVGIGVLWAIVPAAVLGFIAYMRR